MATDLDATSQTSSHSDNFDEDPTLGFQGQNVFRSDTPETTLTEVPTNPDITITCEKCNIYINLRNLTEHRVYHEALKILHYQGNNKPQSLDGLRKRRQVLLRKLRSGKETNVQLREIQRLNDAYELLKSDVQGTFEVERQNQSEINTNVSGISLNCSPPCVNAVGVCSVQNDRWKSYMEDTKVFQDSFGGDKNKCFFAVFDGYHGKFAADMAAAELHHLLLNEMSKFDPKTKSTFATNHADTSTDISQYSFERPATRPDTKQSERELLYEDSVNIVQQIINMCEDKYDELITPRQAKHKDDEEETDDAKENKPIKSKRKNKSPMALKMEQALIKAYYLLDILLSYGKDERSKVRWSGCSALTMVIHSQDPEKILGRDHEILPVTEEEEEGSKASTSPRQPHTMETNSRPETTTHAESSLGYDPPQDLGTIYLANAGNVHGVLVRANKAYKISKDHTPHNQKEKNRIIKAGACISESNKEMRVNGVLSTTRGLGNHGDVTLKKSVLVEPHTMTVPVDQYCQFAIIASHGVWEVFTEQEAAMLLLKLLPSNFIPAPSKISTTLQPLIAESNSQANLTPLLPTPRRVSFSNEALEHHNQRVLSPRTSTMLSEKLRSNRAQGQQRSQSQTDNQAENLSTDIVSNVDPEEDSGNDADVETDADYLTLPTNSRLSNYNPAMTRDQFHCEFARTMAEHLVQAALLGGAKDNITAMVILLPGCGI